MNRSRPLAISRALAARTPTELAAAARAGDEQAVAELYRRTVHRARAAARRRCPDADIDDAVAEGFSRALTRLDQLIDPAAVEAWLIRCVARAAADLARQRRRQPATGDLDALGERVLPPAESAADRALRGMERQDLAVVVSRLQPGPRLLLHLRYHAGFSVHHIATMLRRPDGTVRRQCLEARRAAGQHFLAQQLRPASGDCARAKELLCQAPYRHPSDLAGRRLAAHLGSCRACRDRQAELAAVLAELGLRPGRGLPVARPGPARAGPHQQVPAAAKEVQCGLALAGGSR